MPGRQSLEDVGHSKADVFTVENASPFGIDPCIRPLSEPSLDFSITQGCVKYTWFIMQYIAERLSFIPVLL